MLISHDVISPLLCSGIIDGDSEVYCVSKKSTNQLASSQNLKMCPNQNIVVSFAPLPKPTFVSILPIYVCAEFVLFIFTLQ